MFFRLRYRQVGMMMTATITMMLLWMFLGIGLSSSTGFTTKVHGFDGGWKTTTLRNPSELSSNSKSFDRYVYPPPFLSSKRKRNHHHDMLLRIRGGVDDGDGGYSNDSQELSSNDDSSSLSLISFPCPNEVVLMRMNQVMRQTLNIVVWAHMFVASWKKYRFILDHIWSFYKVMASPYIALIVLSATKNICLIHRFVEDRNSNDEDLSSTLNDDSNSTANNTNTSNNLSPHPTAWYGYGISKRKFRIWLSYQLNGTSNSIHDKTITSRVHLFFPKKKKDAFVREAWLQQHLLTSQTLSQIPDAVQIAVNVFRVVLEDEFKPNNDDSQLLVEFLNTEYGISNTTQIHATNWNKSTNETQLETMQEFLNWFRSIFPYYYNNCRNCGEFSRDIPRESFLGIAYPNETDVEVGKATRVEYFHCQNCGTVTSFPRYNAALSISANRKGRCGEYSLLLFRMLRALGHEVRYVVDCGNVHVWVEIGRNVSAVTAGCFNDGKIDNPSSTPEEGKEGCNRNRIQWLHLDPCEAAVNKNLLYQEWGRNIRSVIAFYIPQRCYGDAGTRLGDESECDEQSSIPVIEDVTQGYTTHTQHSTASSIKQETVGNLSAEIQDKIDALQQ